MKRLVIILLLFFAVGVRGYSQSYKVIYSTNPFYNWSITSTESLDYRIISDVDSKFINGNGSLIITDRPKTIEIISYEIDVDLTGDVLYLCDPPSQIINLSNEDCISYFNNSLKTSCSAGNVYIQIEITPIISFETNTTPESSESNSIPICITDPIRLVASSGFSSYTWQYRIENQSWKNFNPGTGNDVSFSLEDLLGSQATSYLNQNIYFRYTVGNCSNLWATTQTGYKFSFPPPAIDDVIKFDPTCHEGENGGVTSTILSRPLETGESILFDLADENGNILGSNNEGVFENLSPGKYILSIQPITFDYCVTSSSSKSFQIDNPLQLNLLLSNVQPVQCLNTSTGEISFTASGGSGSGYTYSIDSGPSTSIPAFNNLVAGNHEITVKDGLGCSITSTINILDPSLALSADIYITSDYKGSPISCPSSLDASVNIVASNGWGNYTYSATENGTYAVSSSFSNLSAGTHAFWIKDKEGCKISSTVTITPPIELAINDINITPPKCIGEVGSILIDASGGTGTIQYSIDNINFQSSPQFYALAGTYNIFLEDENGCLSTSSGHIIKDPAAIIYNTIISQLSCNGSSDGVISVQSASNGAPPYEYSLDGGAFSSLDTFTDLEAGNYGIAIKDLNGCISTSSVILTEPEVLSVSIVETAILCNGENSGALSANGNGGSGGYTYLWSSGQTTNMISNLSAGTYKVNITDQNGCVSDLVTYSLLEPDEIIITAINNVVNGYDVSCFGGNNGFVDLAVIGGTISSNYAFEWSNGQTSNTLVNAPAGQYSVKVSDDNGCFAETSVEVMEPQALLFSELLISNVSCFQGLDGMLQVSAIGGVGNYNYSIDGGAYDVISSFNNLNAGEHYISVIDLNSCEKTSFFSISEPEKIIINLVGTSDTFCGRANGAIDISVRGGAIPYQFRWNNEFNEKIGVTEDLTDVVGGAYSLLITDNNGCTQVLNSTISNSDGPEVQLESTTGTTCFDSVDGKASIRVTGGQPPYEIMWDNGEVGFNAMNLAKGNTEVSVKDNAGCITFILLDIPGKEEMDLFDLQISKPLCYGDETGSISIEVIGGTLPFIYNWSNGENSSTISDLSAGSYDLNIVDSNNCTFFQSIIIDQPEPISINLDVSSPACANSNDASISVMIDGGTGPYIIYLDGIRQQTNFLPNLAPGIYSFLVQDSNGCSQTSVIDVPEAEPWTILMEDLIICEGQEIDIYAPVGANSFQWYYQSELISVANGITVSQAGQYSLEVVNSSGCRGLGSFIVSTSTEVLEGDFLMSSKAYVGDTVIIIDITYPLPDSINWIIPTSVEIVEITNDLALMIFDNPGTYNIGFETYLGFCVDYYSSSIEILEVTDIPINGRIASGYQPTIQSLEVYPNPNEGIFVVESIFKKSQPANIKVINLQTKQLVIEKSSPINMEHRFFFELPNLAPGAYAVVIESANEIKVTRMIKR